MDVEVKKDVFYGLSAEEVAKISIHEFMEKYANARARRAIKRALEGQNLAYAALIEKVRKLKEKNHPKLKKGIKTHVRDAVILPEWIGLKFLVYNGKEWVEVEITPERIGHRLGEFSPSTHFKQHSGPGIGATKGSRFMSLK